jgi:serine/threonine-protein kinase
MMMLMAHAYEPVVPPDKLRGDLPADLQAVVLRCLEKDPSRRYPEVYSLEQALSSCADADQWTEEQAALWWREHPRPTPGEAVSHPDVPTEIAV